MVTVAAGTTWGDATPCYASHHMMLVLLYGLSMWNEIQRIASLHLAETLRPTALPHDSALHLKITCKLLLSVRLGTSGCSLLPNLDALTAPQSDEMV